MNSDCETKQQYLKLKFIIAQRNNMLKEKQSDKKYKLREVCKKEPTNEC